MNQFINIHFYFFGLDYKKCFNQVKLHLLIFLLIKSGGSNKLILELSFSALFDILLVPALVKIDIHYIYSYYTF